MSKYNIVYANILKILASIAVVVIHVCSMGWYRADSNRYEMDDIKLI